MCASWPIVLCIPFQMCIYQNGLVGTSTQIEQFWGLYDRNLELLGQYMHNYIIYDPLCRPHTKKMGKQLKNHKKLKLKKKKKPTCLQKHLLRQLQVESR